jgi:hypothetical protein
MPGAEVVEVLVAAAQDISLIQAYFVYLEKALKRAPNSMRHFSQVYYTIYLLGFTPILSFRTYDL